MTFTPPSPLGSTPPVNTAAPTRLTGGPPGGESGPEWTFLVKVLGSPEVVTRRGDVIVFERAKALELVTWLAFHRHRPTRAAARAALWDRPMREAVLGNVISEARRALNAAATPPDGSEWIGRGLGETLPLHTGIVTDVDVLRRVWRTTEGCDTDAAETSLAEAVGMIKGIPLDGRRFLWADTEGITSELTFLAMTVAGDLARRRLRRGDLAGVLAATGVGLRVLPGYEEFLALRMRAHARAGNLAAVRSEWATYERCIAVDPWQSRPSDMLLSLRRELLGDHRRT